MATPVNGTLSGRTIILDEPVPPLDGRRVRVLLEPFDEEDAALTPSHRLELWREWTERGPQGPIEDESGPEFP
jgi:energy-coupling factor transporter ATP-binding protein EcfA2